ncbi:MAG: YdeI/OmpD-associated family protein [Gemmatimonadetes bacterium]|nr:YdeI/OmpD-associated family protein [Gemmatimonadota bacterium]
MSPAPTRKPNALDSLEQVYVPDRAAWRRWLTKQHGRSPGIWLVFDKKSSRADRLAYGDAVEEALCFGWIDSLVRGIDDARYAQLFTPRKPKSTWSRSNKVRVERLLAEGLMAAAGLASIELAKANGSWESLDAVEAFVMPDDLAAALAAVPGAAEKFAAFSPSARKAYLHWISQAVRAETRAKRIQEVAGHAGAGRKTRHLEPAAASKKAPAKAAKQRKSAKDAKRAKSARGAEPAKRSTKRR